MESWSKIGNIRGIGVGSGQKEDIWGPESTTDNQQRLRKENYGEKYINRKNDPHNIK